MSRPKGSSDDELTLKFLFANQDGVHVVLRFRKTVLVSEVKAQLMQNWPSGVAPADDAKCIRLICMGRGMLQDARTLEAAKVPGFSTHPTPVNVSVLRRPSQASLQTIAPSTRESSERTNQTTLAAAVAPAATPGCECIIL